MFDQFTIFARHILNNNIYDFNYLTIDPGLSNIGWCYCSFRDFKLFDIGRLSLETQTTYYNNDKRINKIYDYVQHLMIKYGTKTVCIEQINYSKGKHSFGEQSLLKAIGIIYITILSEGGNVIEISNRKAQYVLLRTAKHFNKKIIFDYVYTLLKNNIDYSFVKKIFTRSKNDICDAIFLAYAFRHIILKIIRE